MDKDPAAANAQVPSRRGRVAASIQRLGPSRRAWTLLLVLLIAAGGLAFRLPKLELRPYHVDEAVQAVKTGELLDGGRYEYNPFEFHGPSLYYLTLPILKLRGAENFAASRDADFRLVPVIFGAGLILLLVPLARHFGPVAVLTAALLTAVSPAMVFYSRYYIQEMLLVFFASLALGALWRHLHKPGPASSILLGVAAGLMYATKETSVVFCGAMTVAGATVVLRRRHREGRPLWRVERRHACHLLLALAAAATVAVLLYSSFLTHPRGPLDSVLAFGHYLGRSGGEGSVAPHQHPWHYYLTILAYAKAAPGPWWSEGLILALAAVGLTAAFGGRLPGAIDPGLALLLAVYTTCMTVAFSLIPYKTPWNMLGFLHGLILMAGIGAGSMFQHLRRPGARAVLLVVLLALTGQLAAQAARASFRFQADPRNPYAYAHSVPDVVRLAKRIGEIAALHPEGAAMRVHFITPEYWPLPYYLRKLSRVGYWSEIPATPDAPVIVASPELQEQLQPLLRDTYHAAFYGLRPDVLLVLNIRQDLWDRYLHDKNSKGETSASRSR